MLDVKLLVRNLFSHDGSPILRSKLFHMLDGKFDFKLPSDAGCKGSAGLKLFSHIAYKLVCSKRFHILDIKIVFRNCFHILDAFFCF